MEHDLAVPQIVKHLKSFLMNVKEESGKAGLKVNILKTKIMTSSPNTSWQKKGKKMRRETDFTFWGSKITVEVHFSHEIKTLTPWKKSYDKARQHIIIQRHHFADKGLSSQSCGFCSHVQM